MGPGTAASDTSLPSVPGRRVGDMEVTDAEAPPSAAATPSVSSVAPSEGRADLSVPGQWLAGVPLYRPLSPGRFL